MKTKAAFALTLWLIALSLSCGGGPSGTSASTAQGNLSSVETVRLRDAAPRSLFARLRDLVRLVPRAFAQNAVEGVRVSIEATDLETVTDAAGSFVLRGGFSGPITLVFEREDDDLAARIGVVVPEGGTVTLRNISCVAQSCQAERIEVEERDDDDDDDDGDDGSDGSGSDGSDDGLDGDDGESDSGGDSGSDSDDSDSDDSGSDSSGSGSDSETSGSSLEGESGSSGSDDDGSDGSGSASDDSGSDGSGGSSGSSESG